MIRLVSTSTRLRRCALARRPGAASSTRWLHAHAAAPQASLCIHAPIAVTSRRGRRRDRGALQSRRPSIEYNIEGDPRGSLALVLEVGPDQCTLVGCTGEITSQAGWSAGPEAAVAGRDPYA
jgi:hypothetical protein